MFPPAWNLSESPFCDVARADGYFPAGTFEEALARLEFLVANKLRFGMLLGDAGSGKSLLLRTCAHRMRRQGCHSAVVSVSSPLIDQCLYQLAEQMGAAAKSTDDERTLWRKLVERIQEFGMLQRPCLLLLDDLDQASDAMQSLVIRLINLDAAHQGNCAVVAACENLRVADVHRQLRDRANLRIDLEPWDEADTRQYVHKALHDAGCQQEVFNETALQQIHWGSGGNPRRIRQLANLALVAATASNSETVNVDIVDAVADELVLC